ncbi:MAG: methyltransferase domain-containing protein [Burkholderiales bacterium]|nr:methyltransferase domain-containing protein [Burkholderiales bacterium]
MAGESFVAPQPRPAPERAPGWRERWWALRDRLLARPGFRRAAARFPLTRPLARRRARELFDLVAGFVYSQVLSACVQLRLFDLLAASPQTGAALAARCGLDEAAMLRLLEAAESLRLVQRRGGGRWGLGELGAPLVANEAIAALVEHHAALYADLRDPLALLRAGRPQAAPGTGPGGALARYWPYAAYEAPERLAGAHVAAYSTLMTASQPLVADEILGAYPVARHRCLLDVGGGEGLFLVRAAERAPGLRLMLFDLPAVAERARLRLAQAGLAGRASVHGGDFRSTPLPRGADLITLVRVVHDHDDETALGLLRAAFEALPEGGVLLLAEPMAGTAGAQAMGAAYFGFYLLAMGRGRPRTAQQLEALLRQAGFTQVRPLATALPLQTRVLRARRAAPAA